MSETTWQVTQVTERPGLVEATLQRVEWFKKNPDFAAAVADESDEELPEEFVDALPGDPEADTVELGGSITLDITDGPELHPLDNVTLTLRTVSFVGAAGRTGDGK